MTYPVVNYLGFLGDSPNCLDVLYGTLLSILSIHPYSQRLLTKLQHIDEYQDIPVGMSKRDYQEGWKKAKETKSSGGVILHFGHCKSLAQDDQLAEMEAAFLSIPLQSGYPYQAWNRGVDCTLLKKANSYRVDKLRTIVLFKADFNFINKAVSRKLARMAESKKSIAREQYGSCKNHRSIEHVLNKRLCMDLLRQFKIPGIIAPTD